MFLIFFGYFANAQYDNDLFVIFLPCHTGALAEVSINLKRILNFFGFFCYGLRLATRWVAFLQKAQNDKTTKFVIIPKHQSTYQAHF